MVRQEGPGVPAPSMRKPFGDLDVVSDDEWNAAREKLLAEEKALMKAKDRLVAKRRLLPVTEVDRNYEFIGANGDADLLGLFEGRRQLIVYRFFYARDVENWPNGACSGCSLFADTVVHPAHLAARDTTLVFVTAAPIEKIESLRQRMGWRHIPFYSLPDERFSRDFGVEKLFGINVFVRRGEDIFRTYFLNGRGIEEIGPVWSFLDMTLLGRQETWQEVPHGRPQDDPYTWWRLHDNYGQVAAPNPSLPKGGV